MSEENDVAHDDWAKMDARLDTSPKIRKAGRNGREVFLFLLRRNRLLAGGGADGRVPASNIEPWYLAEQLMMSEADAVTGVGNAVTAGLIAVSDDFVTICGFNEEWGGKAPMSPAEKQKAYRDRGHAKRDAESVTEACNESNALPRREEKRGEEIEMGPRASRKRPSTTLPDGFQPSDAHQALASELGVDLRSEFAKFVDHAQANGKRFADWNAGLRTWLRNAHGFARDRGPPRNSSSVVQFRPRKILNPGSS